MTMYSPTLLIPYEERPDSPQESLSWDSFQVTRILRVAWANRLRFAVDMLGWTSGGIFYPPDLYNPNSESGALVNCYAREVNIVGLGEKSSTAGQYYDYAEVTVTYRTPDADKPPEGETVYVTESLEPAAEFITLSRDSLYFGTGANKVSLKDQNVEPPAKIIRMTDWVYTLHRLTTLPDAVFTLPGKINKYAITSRSLGKTFEVGTLLCGNPSMSRQITNTGVTAWEITFRFTYRNHGTAANPKGWQYFPRTDNVAASNKLQFERLYDVDGDDVDIYEEASFAGLLI